MVVHISRSLRFLTLAVTTALLASCGGSDDNGGTTDNNAPLIPEEDIIVTTDTVEGDEIVTTTEVKGDVINSEVLPEPDDIDVVVTVDPADETDVEDVITEEPDKASYEEVVFDRLNTRRSTCGFGELRVSQKLTDAAKNHANYILHMSKYSTNGIQGHYEVQTDTYSGINNPYYSGRKVENRIATAGAIGSQALSVDYKHKVVGENLSFRNFNQGYADIYTDKDLALQSVNSLFAAPYHLASLVSPYFSQVGISYGRGTAKKPMTLSDGTTVPAQNSILEIVMARPAAEQIPESSGVLSYPCDGIENTAYELRNEVPNPFKGTARNLTTDPIGQPIYILGDGAIVVTDYSIKDAANSSIPMKQLTSQNDPNSKLKSNEVVLMPLKALLPNHMYRVTYSVSINNHTPKIESFSFKTKAK